MILYCPPTSPCSCIGSPCNPCISPCPPTVAPEDCLVLCDIVVMPDDGVGPCGNAGTIDVVASGNHKTEVCGNTPLTFTLISFSGPIVDASVTPEGVLTWITGTYDPSNIFGEVILKGRCGEYASYLQVLIGIKDLCKNVDCAINETCDQCTGNCVETPVDLQVDDANLNVDTQIQ